MASLLDSLFCQFSSLFSKEGATPRSLSPFPCASKPGIPSLLRKEGQWETDVGIVGSILQNGSQLPSWCVIRAGPAPPLQETAGSCCWVLGPAPRLVGREQSLQLDTPATWPARDAVVGTGMPYGTVGLKNHWEPDSIQQKQISRDSFEKSWHLGKHHFWYRVALWSQEVKVLLCMWKTFTNPKIYLALALDAEMPYILLAAQSPC